MDKHTNDSRCRRSTPNRNSQLSQKIIAYKKGGDLLLLLEERTLVLLSLFVIYSLNFFPGKHSSSFIIITCRIFLDLMLIFSSIWWFSFCICKDIVFDEFFFIFFEFCSYLWHPFCFNRSGFRLKLWYIVFCSIELSKLTFLLLGGGWVSVQSVGKFKKMKTFL